MEDSDRRRPDEVAATSDDRNTPFSSTAAVARAFALAPQPPTLLDGVLQSIVTPGAGPGLVAAVNGSLLVMVAATAWIAWTLDDGFARRELLPLLGVGAALAVGLLVAFNAFVALGGADAPAPATSASGLEGGGAEAADGGKPKTS